MTFICKYCKNIFTTKSILKTHQKNAKYCLGIQGEKSIYKCTGCDKILSTKWALERHTEICIEKIKKDYEKKLEDQKNIYEEKLKKEKENEREIRDELVQIYEKRISDLQRLAERAIDKPTNITTNNTINIDTMMNNLETVTTDRILNSVKNLSLKHIKKGAPGYAEYILNYPLKNSVICVDYGRRIINYKDRHGNRIRDPKCVSIMKRICNFICDKHSELLSEYEDEIRDSVDHILIGTPIKIEEYRSMVKHCIQGDSDVKNNKVFQDLIEIICRKSLKENLRSDFLIKLPEEK